MTRPPVLQTAFALGVGAAILGGVKQLLDFYEYTQPSSIRPTGIASQFPTKTFGRVTTTVFVTEHVVEAIHPEQNLHWSQIVDFFVQKFDQLDVRIPIVALTICVLGPSIFCILGGRRNGNPREATLMTDEATQTDSLIEEKESDESQTRSIELRPHHYQYNPAERALLQFGKSKSDSILFRYVPVEYEDGDYDSSNLPKEEQLSERMISTDEKDQRMGDFRLLKESINDQSSGYNEPLTMLNGAVMKITKNSSRDHQPHELSDKESSSFTESVTMNPFDNKKELSLKSFSSLSSSRGSGLNTTILDSSDNHLRLQMTPIKTDTQLNSDSAYSQPFTY